MSVPVVRRRRAVDRALSDQLRRGRLFAGLKNSRARRGTTRRRRAHAAALRRRGGGVPRAPRERCPTRAMGRATRRAATRRGVPASNPPTRRRSRREDAGARRTRVPDVLARDGTRADGRVVTRGDAAEARAAREWEANRAALLERVAHDVRAEAEAKAAAAGSSSGFGDGFDEAAERRARDALDAAGLLERRVRRAMKLRVSGLRRVGPDGRVDGPTGAALLTVFDAHEDPRALSPRGRGTNSSTRLRRSRWMPRTHRWA